MGLSSLFYGMEAYLDGDVEINNNVGAADTDDAVAAADQSAEIASDVADANSEAKDSEIQAEMLIQMSKLYTHVKTYGIDRTFLSIYNSNGELNKVCGIRFPSCESMPVTGNPHSQYSARFIAAMEDEKIGFWTKVKNFILKIWEWIVEKAFNILYKLVKLVRFRAAKLNKLCDDIEAKYDTSKVIDTTKLDFLTTVTSADVGPEVFRLFGLIVKTAKDTNQNINDFCQFVSNQAEKNPDSLKPDAPEVGTVNKSMDDGLSAIKANEDKIIEIFSSRTMNVYINQINQPVSNVLKKVRSFATNCNKTLALCNEMGDLAKDTASAARTAVAKVRNISKTASELGKTFLKAIKTSRHLMITSINTNNRLALYTQRVFARLKSPEFTKRLTLKSGSGSENTNEKDKQ